MKNQTLFTKAITFANELTDHNIIQKNLKLKAEINSERKANNKVVKIMLLQRGVN